MGEKTIAWLHTVSPRDIRLVPEQLTPIDGLGFKAKICGEEDLYLNWLRSTDHIQKGITSVKYDLIVTGVTSYNSCLAEGFDLFESIANGSLNSGTPLIVASRHETHEPEFQGIAKHFVPGGIARDYVLLHLPENGTLQELTQKIVFEMKKYINGYQMVTNT